LSITATGSFTSSGAQSTGWGMGVSVFTRAGWAFIDNPLAVGPKDIGETGSVRRVRPRRHWYPMKALRILRKRAHRERPK
jgi:hypothetical protein